MTEQRTAASRTPLSGRPLGFPAFPAPEVFILYKSVLAVGRTVAGWAGEDTVRPLRTSAGMESTRFTLSARGGEGLPEALPTGQLCLSA